jgi:VanZ family protein
MMRYLRSPHHQAVAFALFVGVLMLLPGGAVPPVPSFDWADKAVHLVLFLVLSVLVIRSFTATARFARPDMTGATVTFVYALFLELSQGVIPGRSWDPFDVLAGGVGVLVGMILQSAVLRG